MPKSKWSITWPTEEGFYWLYGWSTESMYDRLPEFYFVEVRDIMSDGLAYITKGQFLDRARGAAGVWQRAKLPEPPQANILGLRRLPGRTYVL